MSQSWQFADGTGRSESFTYSDEDGSLEKISSDSAASIVLSYDALKRCSGYTVGDLNSGEDAVYAVAYDYKDRSDELTTGQISKLSFPGMSADYPTLSYEYDSLGNITKIIQSGWDSEANTSYEWVSGEYAYDDQNQLISEQYPGKRIEYSYDTAGNLLEVRETDLSIENAEPVVYKYTYGNSDWKDLLTGYGLEGNIQPITYDAVGNPLSYYNGDQWTFTWIDCRRLASAVSGETSVSYAYDADGYRTSKTVGDVTYTYTYLGGKLVKETWGENVLEFLYDHLSRPYAVIYNGTIYYYVLNLQGDVMMIVDEYGSLAARYQYDAWGNQIEVLSSQGNIGTVNPLRYRGYVWDEETGLYYLNSRYYDPVVRRFINADGYMSTGQGVSGHNMFAYCNNCPVLLIDSTGSRPVVGTSLNNETADERTMSVCAMNPKLAAAQAKKKEKQKNKEEYAVLRGETDTYRGVPVIRSDLLGTSAFSFGAIFIGSGNKADKYGANLLRH